MKNICKQLLVADKFWGSLRVSLDVKLVLYVNDHSEAMNQKILKHMTLNVLSNNILVRSHVNLLIANPTNWSNTLKQFVGKLLECVWPFFTEPLRATGSVHTRLPHFASIILRWTYFSFYTFFIHIRWIWNRLTKGNSLNFSLAILGLIRILWWSSWCFQW